MEILDVSNVWHQYATTFTVASCLEICAGDSITLDADFVYGGTSPSYQWVKNGIDIPFATSNTYTDLLPANGNVITCRVISSEVCPSPNPAVSAPIIMNITPVKKPKITIKKIR